MLRALLRRVFSSDQPQLDESLWSPSGWSSGAGVPVPETSNVVRLAPPTPDLVERSSKKAA